MIKSVVITGASAGIGKAIAYEFARRGVNLVLMARRLELLEELAADIGKQHPDVDVHCISLDVAQVEDIAPALEQARNLVGQLDCVIANAGITAVNKTGAGDFSKEQRVIQVNLIGGMATIDAAVRIFRQQGKGIAVGISSVSAFKGIPGSAAYSASKAGFSNYLDSTRMELQKHGITVIAVHPGFVNTEISPNMDKLPFVISAEKAAKEIVNGIVKGNTNIIVPVLPWSVLGRVLPFMPDSIIKKAF